MKTHFPRNGADIEDPDDAGKPRIRLKGGENNLAVYFQGTGFEIDRGG